MFSSRTRKTSQSYSPYSRKTGQQRQNDRDDRDDGGNKRSRVSHSRRNYDDSDDDDNNNNSNNTNTYRQGGPFVSPRKSNKQYQNPNPSQPLAPMPVNTGFYEHPARQAPVYQTQNPPMPGYAPTLVHPVPHAAVYQNPPMPAYAPNPMANNRAYPMPGNVAQPQHFAPPPSQFGVVPTIIPGQSQPPIGADRSAWPAPPVAPGLVQPSSLAGGALGGNNFHEGKRIAYSNSIDMSRNTPSPVPPPAINAQPPPVAFPSSHPVVNPNQYNVPSGLMPQAFQQYAAGAQAGPSAAGAARGGRGTYRDFIRNDGMSILQRLPDVHAQVGPQMRALIEQKFQELVDIVKANPPSRSSRR